MIRTVIASFLLLSSGIPCLAEDKPPTVPAPADAVRYVRETPVCKSREMDKARGDELLAALDTGRVLEEWGKAVRKNAQPNMMICFFGHVRYSFTIELKNGGKYVLGFEAGGGILFLDEGMYVVAEPARTRVQKVLLRIEDDLRKEVVAAPRPCTYVMGTVNDGGTLSGVARLFYGDARKWKQIYEANRATIKNPDVIGGSEKLTIPKLE